ncbi:MAG: hypothetical protein Q9169_005334 [Polycauliona sp. 2 TL-2023]
MPSKPKKCPPTTNRQKNKIATCTSNVSLPAQNGSAQSAPAQTMASSHIDTAVVDPLQPLHHLDEAHEHNHYSANLVLSPDDCLPGPDNAVPASSPVPALQQKTVPPKRKPPARRKTVPATSEGRVTRGARKNRPSLAPSTPQASLLARAHSMAPSLGVQQYAFQAEDLVTNEQSAFPSDAGIQPHPSSTITLPQTQWRPTPSFLSPHTFPNADGTLAVSAEPVYHQQGSFILNTATQLPWPTQQSSQFSTHPLSPLNRPLSLGLPPQMTCMYPIPKGLEDSAIKPTERLQPPSIENGYPRHSIVTHHKLGFNSNDIAPKAHLADFDPRLATLITAEHTSRKADESEYSPWYGQGVQRLRVFERDDPDYLCLTGGVKVTAGSE